MKFEIMGYHPRGAGDAISAQEIIHRTRDELGIVAQLLLKLGVGGEIAEVPAKA